MSIERSKEKDYKPLTGPSKPIGSVMSCHSSLTASGAANDATTSEPQNLVNLSYNYASESEFGASRTNSEEGRRADILSPAVNISEQVEQQGNAISRSPKAEKKLKKDDRDRELLGRERWLFRNGHFATYAALYLFSIMVLFRPYEIVPGLEFLGFTAFYLAIATLALFFPNQFAAEGNLTMLSTEVKAILALTVLAVISIPIAKDPVLAGDTFKDIFVKAVIIFIVMVNVVRTRKRLMGMIWLSFGVGIYLGVSALLLYMEGKFSVEDYRVGVTETKGMFGNPNEMALHFVMMTPLTLTLGIASKNLTMRIVYFSLTALFVAANMVTYSRGGFLGLVFSCMVLAWKLGRKYRFKVTVASILIGAVGIIAAPGNYGLRVLSIFIPVLDGVGSSDQRKALLERSLLVTARNPWGIGIGNFPLVGFHDLQTHNAFTQVSAEIGILGLVAYLVFMLSPFRKLGAIERTLFAKQETTWFYYLSIGLQASIVGYLVSSFFASVAYNWFIYYLIAYAVAFRRIYSIENGLAEDVKAPLWDRRPAEAV
ncbi:MAG: O-antigen ligase family protein [Pyrinomonadaceae bacterium]